MRRLRFTIAGAGVAVLIVTGAAIAIARSFTLRVEKNVHVTNNPTAAFRVKPVNKHEAVAVGAAGYAVYTFQGETTHHLICMKTSNPSTNCWAFWPPVAVGSGKSLSKQLGISGKLGTFRNHGTRQLTLNGQPLYYFTPDLQAGNKHQATGDELKTFGSVWHIVVAHVKGAAGQHTSTSSGSGSSSGGSGSSPGGNGYGSTGSGSSSGGSGSTGGTGSNPYPPGW